MMPLPMVMHFVMTSSPRGVRSTWDEQLLGAKPAWVQRAPTDSDTSGKPVTVTTAIAAVFGDLLDRSPGKARQFLKSLVQWVETSGYSRGDRIPMGPTFMDELKQLMLKHIDDAKAWAGVIESLEKPTASHHANA